MGYHFNVKFVSRGKGQSLVAKGAYDARAKFREERTGELKDYTYKQDRPVQSFLPTGKNFGPEFQDNEKLLNLIDAAETRSDAQTGIRFTAALPKQLSGEDRSRMFRDFMREEFWRKGIAAIGHIHPPHEHTPDPRHANDNDVHHDEEEPGHNDNWHFHVTAPTRTVGADGKFSDKKYITWDNYNEYLEHKRERYAELGARYLEKAGYKVEAERWRYGHLTQDEQREKALERGDHEWAEIKAKEASKHLGPAAAAMERKRQETERGDLARDQAKLAEINLQIWGIQHEAKREIEWQDTLGQAAIDKEQRELGGREETPEAGELAAKVLDGAGAVLEIGIEALEGLMDFLTGATPKSRHDVFAEIMADIAELKQRGTRTVPEQDLLSKLLDAGERLAELGMNGFEMVADFFGGGTVLTPERLQAAIDERKELRREAAAEERLEKWAAARQRHERMERESDQRQRDYDRLHEREYGPDI